MNRYMNLGLTDNDPDCEMTPYDEDFLASKEIAETFWEQGWSIQEIVDYLNTKYPYHYAREGQTIYITDWTYNGEVTDELVRLLDKDDEDE